MVLGACALITLALFDISCCADELMSINGEAFARQMLLLALEETHSRPVAKATYLELEWHGALHSKFLQVEYERADQENAVQVNNTVARVFADYFSDEMEAVENNTSTIKRSPAVDLSKKVNMMK